MSEQPSRDSARVINETIRYTVWAVYQRTARSLTDPDLLHESWRKWLAQNEELGIVVRGIYDVSGMRADADVMFWLHGEKAEDLQKSLRALRQTVVGDSGELAWSIMALHRPAEFNKGHVPAFMMGKPAGDWLCVYPFNRSYEWYLLPEEERRRMLVEHGMKGRDYEQVLSNTVSTFALNDYEWMLALEAPQLHDLVDLMRTMRYTDARRHVREETPFYTGRRISFEEMLEVLA